MQSIRKYLKRSDLIVSVYDKVKEEYYRKFITDTKLIQSQFIKKVGREVELKNPIKYNDKMQWLKLNWKDPIATKCADKFCVREIVAERIGLKYLNDLYSVYESVENIDVNHLPEQFVLKGTHGSGFNIICKNKNEVDWEVEFSKMKRWLSRNYFWFKRESIYKDIKPRIICEKYLVQDDGDELRDYRFFCFNGEPKFITVDFSITDKKRTRRNLYDLEWSLMDAEISYPKETNIKVKKPEKLEEMIELSKRLSSGFPHARVDFYYIDNKIIFGEITFFHQSGMGKISPEEFEVKMGNWLELPQKI
ncbi:ATP-grasp fold amidoligase family protein [uncultured Ilyobacter sp.]|uniref:ATP-grasp fold amidoligase family protein n=1 Tax=uncultured Ilyobacter sp. TaxID=544433 RepID=UPI002AA6C36A|nr:ATP-grasp fold amidoligase family protein [uncultured Ilyobacter sp.]